MVYKRGNTWWYKFRFHGSEIRESAGTNSKTVAKRIEQQRRRSLEEGFGGIRRNRPKLFRVASEEWLTTKKPTLAPKSIRIEECNLKHLLPIFGGMLCCDIEAADVARYQEKRTKAEAAAATINLEIGTLRAILRRSGLWARIQPEIRMLTERSDVGRAITEEEEARLLRACSKSRSRSLLPSILVALNTGLRYSELVSLRWRQVDLSKRRLTVGDSKTEAGAGRVIPLNDRAFSALSIWAARFPERIPEHFLFPSEKYGQGGAVYDTDPEKPLGRLKEAWEAAKKRTMDLPGGLPPVSCRWHDLRHTFCTRLLEGGTPFPRLSAIMGWSAATTARMAQRYGHVSPESLRVDVAILDREIEPEWVQNSVHSGLVAVEEPN